MVNKGVGKRGETSLDRYCQLESRSINEHPQDLEVILGGALAPETPHPTCFAFTFAFLLLKFFFSRIFP